MKRTLLIVLLAAACVVPACRKATETAPPAKNMAIPAPTPLPVYPEVIGVKECDAYIFKVRNCLQSKVPTAAQIPLQIALEKGISEWKKTAAFPDKIPELAPACQLAEQASKRAMERFNCQW